MTVFYFGCDALTRTAGHFMWNPGWRRNPDDLWLKELMYLPGSKRMSVDGTLAPRLDYRDYTVTCDFITPRSIGKQFEELPQGHYLHHAIEWPHSTFTILSWWDRTQGDTRRNSSSTFFVLGKWSAEDVLEKARANFPDVFWNLAREKVDLVHALAGEKWGGR